MRRHLILVVKRMVKIREQGPKADRVWSLEMTSSIGRRRLARVIKSIPSTHVSEFPGFFSWLFDRPFCRFEFMGYKFTVEASWPAGDTFEISLEPRGCKPETLVLKQALEERL